MFREGVVDEVPQLGEQEFSIPAATALGIRDISALIAGEITEADCIGAIQQATRRFAKRQSTWFKREKAFQTVCIGKDETAESVAGRIFERFPELKNTQRNV